MTRFNDLRSRGRLTNLGTKDVPVIVDTKNATFTGHKDIG